MASLSAQLIVPSRPWRMTRIQTRISHVHPTASIHQRGTLLRLCYCGVLRAGAPPGMLWSDGWELLGRLGIEEERAGGGPGRTGGGPEQEDRGRIRADDVYPECWRSIHLSDDGGDTPRASGHCMCDLHMHMGRYDHPEVVLILFRSTRFQSLCR
jgi:hypothetical protein